MALAVKKYKETILYLCDKLGGEIRGKKKLAKLLYYVDFDFFEKNHKSLTGETYKALPMGPFPETMTKIIGSLIKEKKLIFKVEKERADFLPTEIYECAAKPENIFSKAEKEILDRVVRLYGELNGKQLEDLTHAEAPYVATEPKKEIAYELAYYRGTNF